VAKFALVARDLADCDHDHADETQHSQAFGCDVDQDKNPRDHDDRCVEAVEKVGEVHAA